MLTISELAGFVGVTVRAVRHYHARGLLPEPPRDASGYRRYDAQAVVDLIRIKSLAGAGVPLARVSGLLAAEPEQFAEAVEQIDRDLRARIRELERHRKQVARLAAGESIALPAEVVDYLGRLRAIGITERLVAIEREGWIMLCARSGSEVGQWARQKAEGLDDEEFQDLYRTFDQAFDWSAEDPRLTQLAAAMTSFAARNNPEAAKADDRDPFQAPPEAADETLTELLKSQADVAPAWRRLRELLSDVTPATP